MPGDDPELPEESILSGLTVEQLRDGETHAPGTRRKLGRLKAPRERVSVEKLDVMLAETGDKPFSKKGWVFELKYDGYRLVAARDPNGDVYLRYRSGIDATPVFPRDHARDQGAPL